MNKKQSRAKKKGFTLIELLVVMGIIGVLALAVAPTMLSKVDEAKEKTDISNANAIAMAVKTEIIEGKIDSFSGTIDDLKNLADKYFDGNFPAPQSVDDEFEVTINKNAVTVKAGQKQFYPILSTTSGAGGGK
ncbi:MAG: type II secretion system protein [Clostridium sp.]